MHIAWIQKNVLSQSYLPELSATASLQYTSHPYSLVPVLLNPLLTMRNS